MNWDVIGVVWKLGGVDELVFSVKFKMVSEKLFVLCFFEKLV